MRQRKDLRNRWTKTPADGFLPMEGLYVSRCLRGMVYASPEPAECEGEKKKKKKGR